MNKGENNYQTISKELYEHLCFSQIPFSGFVEGIGFTITDTIVTARRLNKSGSQNILVLDKVEKLYYNSEMQLFSESIFQNQPQLYYNQGKMPFVYYWMSKSSASDNFLVNMGYSMANDYFQLAQIFSFGLLARDEWSNPITGSSFGNLDGTPNYDPTPGIINSFVFVNNYLAGGMKGATSGMFYIKGVNIQGGVIKKAVMSGLNYLIDIINNNLSKGRIITQLKSLSNFTKEKEENKTDEIENKIEEINK